MLVKVDLDQVTGAGKSLVSPVGVFDSNVYAKLEKSLLKGEEIYVLNSNYKQIIFIEHLVKKAGVVLELIFCG